MNQPSPRKNLKEILWPPALSGPARVTAVLELLLGLFAIVAALLSTFGAWELSGNVFEGLILFAVGLVLLTLLVDAGDRQTSRGAQQQLLEAVRTATGQLQVHEIRSNEIKSGLRQLLEESNEWTFRGGSGRYLRNATLPALSMIRDRDVPVEIQILDPRDEYLCRQYAEYRSRQRSGATLRPDEGRMETIRFDLLSNVFAAVWYNANSRIKARVLLLKSFSPLRYDIGSTGLYVTLPDPDEPALFATRDSWFYVSVLDEMRQSVHGHPTLSWSAQGELNGLRKEDVDEAAVRLGLLNTLVVDPASRVGTPLLDGPMKEANLDFKAIAERVFLEIPPY
jgi:hypothetical protein